MALIKDTSRKFATNESSENWLKYRIVTGKEMSCAVTVTEAVAASPLGQLLNIRLISGI
ncbi:hypothetical protein gpAD87_24155 [Paenibacillus sp. AD87]|nr:hypothetical protein gpAD87_24155 [Paenibacillus sp. AD87]